MFMFARLYLCLAAAGLLLSGCAATEFPFIVFPLPPEKPRLQWLGTFANENDFPKSGMQNFMAGLTGSSAESFFKSPYGITSDSSGQIYVADSLDQNLRVYDLKNKKVEYYTKNPVFWQPLGLDVDRADNLYVVDGKKRMVLVFNAKREPLHTIGSPADFKIPVFVEVDDVRDRVYVSDPLADKIVVFTRAGEKVQEIGPDLGETEYLHNPQGMAIDKDGNLYVAEMLHSRISILSPSGEFVRAFGERGDAAYQFEAPKDVDIDSDGNLWVADARRPQFYAYSKEGELLLAVGSASRLDQSAIALSSAVSVSVDGRDRVLITDRINQRFSAWQYRSSAYEAVHPLTSAEQAVLDEVGKRKKALEEGSLTPGGAQKSGK